MDQPLLWRKRAERLREARWEKVSVTLDVPSLRYATYPEVHPIPDMWTTFVPAKMVHISEKSIKQKAI